MHHPAWSEKQRRALIQPAVLTMSGVVLPASDACCACHVSRLCTAAAYASGSRSTERWPRKCAARRGTAVRVRQAVNGMLQQRQGHQPCGVRHATPSSNARNQPASCHCASTSWCPPSSRLSSSSLDGGRLPMSAFPGGHGMSQPR